MTLKEYLDKRKKLQDDKEAINSLTYQYMQEHSIADVGDIIVDEYGTFFLVEKVIIPTEETDTFTCAGIKCDSHGIKSTDKKVCYFEEEDIKQVIRKNDFTK